MQDRAAEVVRAMSHVAKVFVLVPVEDEIGEATVRCALDGANLLGPQPGQIKPHRQAHKLCWVYLGDPGLLNLLIGLQVFLYFPPPPPLPPPPLPRATGAYLHMGR